MLIQKMFSSTEKVLVKGITKNGKVLFGFFKSDLTFVRPSNQSEWDYAVENWQEIPSTMRDLDDPFPTMRNIRGLIIAFYGCKHPKKGWAGAFLKSVKGNRITYTTLNRESAKNFLARLKEPPQSSVSATTN